MAKTPKKTKMSAKNIAAGFLMALLALSLLGFGVEGFGGRTSSIGSVGNRDISANEFARALRSEMNALQSQVGQPITIEQARLFGLDQRVLEQVITGAVLDNESERLGISAGDATIQEEIFAIPAFRGLSGNFDREAYRFAIQNAGMSEREFEESIRADIARTILQRAVTSGASAPQTMLDPLLEFQAQTRDVSVISLAATDLPAPVGTPDQAALEAFYNENIARYTQPEGKRIAYAWITPEMVIDTIEVDEDILRQAYEARASEFRQPERRLVERLVFADDAAADAARARLDAGEARFEDLVAERGLSLDDVDMGDVTRAQLGAAGDAVFALTAPGITGPAPTPLGPALFRMNAILAAQEITFEDAREQLRDEQLSDLARRNLLDDLDLFEDLIAGGATIAELADETTMQAGEIDWRPDTREGIAAYTAFREAARALEEGTFPEVRELEDGGLFVIDYIETLPEAPIPLEDIRIQVINDWRNAQVLVQLRALAEEITSALESPSESPEFAVAPVRFEGLARTDIMPDLPRTLVATSFEMAEGETRIEESETRVHILTLEGIQSPDLMMSDVADLRAALEVQLEQSFAQDLFIYFSAALRDGSRLQLNQAMIDAVLAGF